MTGDKKISSVLMIGHPEPSGVNFGADFVKTCDEALELLKTNEFSVVVLPADPKSNAVIQVAQKNKDLPPLFILVAQPFASASRLMESFELFAILDSYSSPQLEDQLQKAIEHFGRQQQTQSMQKLVREQNHHLLSLSSELKAKIEKREKNLVRAQNRQLSTNRRLEALHGALIALYKAQSVGEMENLLNMNLTKAMDLTWTRILFLSQSQLAEQLINAGTHSVFTAELWSGQRLRGQVVFARDIRQPFSRDENEFLAQIAEGIGLSLDRLTKLEQAENLKQQWEATFDAIVQPLCLADSQFRILRTNKAFATACGREFTELIGADAFHAFLGQPIDLSSIKNHSGKMRIEQLGQPVKHFDVSCHVIHSGKPGIVLLFFQDVTENLRLERQILESAKLAELGTIGSSIAHELNNPLGGLLSFLQLIKMDLPADSKHLRDIEEMEEAGHRCKEIVENLLGFSRQQSSSEQEEFDLRDPLLQALKLMELKTRAQGIRIEQSIPPEPIVWSGFSEALAQAFRNILQNSVEAIESRRLREPHFEGKITVDLTVGPTSCSVEVSDNGPGIEEARLNKIFNPLFTTKDPKVNAGLGLTVAFQIFEQHHGRLEIYSQPNIGTTARISFVRPDLPGDRQVFDGKI